jgi:hypothetical protein
MMLDEFMACPETLKFHTRLQVPNQAFWRLLRGLRRVQANQQHAPEPAPEAKHFSAAGLLGKSLHITCDHVCAQNFPETFIYQAASSPARATVLMVSRAPSELTVSGVPMAICLGVPP